MASQKSAIPRKPRAIKRVEDLDENMLASKLDTLPTTRCFSLFLPQAPFC